MSRTHPRPATSALLSVLLAACAGADTREHEIVLDLDALRATGDESFAAMDLDGDGMITPAEFAPRRIATGIAHRAPRVFLFAGDEDMNHDLDMDVDVEIDSDMEPFSVALAEEFATVQLGIAEDSLAATRAFVFEPRQSATFDSLDADGDGLLSREEYEQAQQQRGEMRRQIEVDMARDMVRTRTENAFSGFDINDDGVITRDEWPSPDGELAALDRDGDGRLTASELGADGPRRIIHRSEAIQRP